MKILGIIPARMASTRLPGKPLKDIGGKTLIQRVWEQASKCTMFSELYIATDSPEILEEGKRIKANVLETSVHAQTGSDRVAEAVKILKSEGKQFDLIANVQGDMPFIKPTVIAQALSCLQSTSLDFGMATIATPIATREEFERPSVVKVVLSAHGQALYFSRGQIPYPRSEPEHGEAWGLKHIGLYVFRPQTLEMLSSLTQSLPEKREGLEQLRLLCNGVKIKVEIIERELLEPSIEVDTPDDLARACVLASKQD